MKGIIVFVLCFAFSSITVYSQQVNYFRVSLGPKWEKYTVQNPGALTVVPNLDVGAGLYLGKNLNENWRAEIGIVKNDYAVKIKLELPEATFFEGFVYPTVTTYQLPVLGMYEKMYNQDISYFVRGGFHLFLSRNESRTGVNLLKEEKVDMDGNVTNEAELTTYGNTLESGNILFRLDAGLYFWINEILSLEVGGGIKASTLPISSFKVDYSTSSVNHENAVFTSNGMATHVHLGIRYQISK